MCVLLLPALFKKVVNLKLVKIIFREHIYHLPDQNNKHPTRYKAHISIAQLVILL